MGVLKTDHILEIEVSLWCISLQVFFFFNPSLYDFMEV